jgi:demethylmenaquinone methyltransferase/2-methoxy-6-polyprenyl-1,4-benzoquinol methylase
MFDAIAPRYDLLNRTLSLGVDRRWRRRAVDSLRLDGSQTVVDVCTGTADIALESMRGGRAARVVGVDFAGAMLALGQCKVHTAGEGGRILLARGDAERLPIADQSADGATVAFGIRNVQRPEVACAELARVLRPGGRLAILEFGMPRVPGVRSIYQWYFSRLLPRVGRAVSGHSAAYSYLPASVGSFPSPDSFMTILRQAGFTKVLADPLTFGIVYLYTAVRTA